MARPIGVCLFLCSILFSFGLTAAEDGKVTLPISLWERMLSEVESSKKPDQPAISICPMERKIDGIFRKGLFSAKMTYRFQILDNQGHIRVPVLDAGASLGQVLIGGQRTSLLRENNMYTLGVDRPGTYEVRLEFFWGKEQDRFARQVKFSLPPAGVTQVSVLVPESDIEAQLAHGALVSTEPAGVMGTRLEGNLDASGRFDLSWNRKLTHKAEGHVRKEARINSLFTIHESTVTGLSALDVNVLEGEIDRLELRLPPEIEVVKVEGDAVLQWHTEASGGGKLTVLFRYLVENRTRVMVFFQFPMEADRPIALRMPLPVSGDDMTMTGAMGILGPAGITVKVVEQKAVTELSLRDMPMELTELAANPLLYGFSFTQEPSITLAVTPNHEVALTSTVIDEVEASTVLIEDGSEITKMKVRIRNNTRQYLSVRLPEKAQLTHSLIDGQPMRPATSKDGNFESLLFPLRQSERVGQKRARSHIVREGETLSDIANHYYSNPSKYQVILEENRGQLGSANGLVAGQQLSIPIPRDVKVEESSFVIELAYKLIRPPLGTWGRVAVTLPKLDVDAMKAVWHLYVPEALSPLSFSANMTQYDSIRYDPFRRVRDFLHHAFGERNAWASSKYMNVLRQRKEIYRVESEKRESGEVMVSSFPLVGHRYKFRRSLLGQETPSISLTYVSTCFTRPIHWGTMALSFLLVLLLLRPNKRLKVWLLAGGGFLLLLIISHYFLGNHRRILWGMDLALLFALGRTQAPKIWHGLLAVIRSPWELIQWLTLRSLTFVVGCCVVLWFVLSFPLLMSSTGLVVLYAWWWWKNRQGKKEVAHV